MLLFSAFSLHTSAFVLELMTLLTYLLTLYFMTFWDECTATFEGCLKSHFQYTF